MQSDLLYPDKERVRVYIFLFVFLLLMLFNAVEIVSIVHGVGKSSDSNCIIALLLLLTDLYQSEQSQRISHPLLFCPSFCY